LRGDLKEGTKVLGNEEFGRVKSLGREGLRREEGLES